MVEVAKEETKPVNLNEILDNADISEKGKAHMASNRTAWWSTWHIKVGFSIKINIDAEQARAALTHQIVDQW